MRPFNNKRDKILDRIANVIGILIVISIIFLISRCDGCVAQLVEQGAFNP